MKKFVLFFYRFIALLFLKNKRKIKAKEGVFDLLAEGVVLLDKKGSIKQVNSSAAFLLKKAKSDLLGKRLPQSSLLGAKAEELLATSLEMNIPITDSFSLAEEKKRFFHLLAIPTKEGSALIVQDVSSEQKILEVGRDFVANASHELKTPITVIKGFAETLQDMPDLPREMVNDMLEKIVRSCDRMNHLVRSLLMLSDIENIPLLSCSYSDLGQIARDCKSATTAIHPSAHITIIQDKEVFAEVEEGIFELALINLLDNAAKYSPNTAEITVKIWEEKNSVYVQVSDKGAGIPQEDIEHVFERFYTVNKAHSRKLGGAGLGLSLVKKIIDKHEGKLFVESTLGKGTTFTITLPKHLRGGR